MKHELKTVLKYKDRNLDPSIRHRHLDNAPSHIGLMNLLVGGVISCFTFCSMNEISTNNFLELDNNTTPFDSSRIKQQPGQVSSHIVHLIKK